MERYVKAKFFPNGKKQYEGVFDSKGLIRGIEYYPDGNMRFSGQYEHNSGYGPNYPISGKYYGEDGTLLYDGEFLIRKSGVGWPFVDVPEDYGPVVLKSPPGTDKSE